MIETTGKKQISTIHPIEIRVGENNNEIFSSMLQNAILLGKREEFLESEQTRLSLQTQLLKEGIVQLKVTYEARWEALIENITLKTHEAFNKVQAFVDKLELFKKENKEELEWFEKILTNPSENSNVNKEAFDAFCKTGKSIGAISKTAGAGEIIGYVQSQVKLTHDHFKYALQRTHLPAFKSRVQEQQIQLVNPCIKTVAIETLNFLEVYEEQKKIVNRLEEGVSQQKNVNTALQTRIDNFPNKFNSKIRAYKWLVYLYNFEPAITFLKFIPETLSSEYERFTKRLAEGKCNVAQLKAAIEQCMPMKEKVVTLISELEVIAQVFRNTGENK